MPSFSRAFYRVRQVFHALFPRLDAGHMAQARSLLNDGEYRLFTAMEKRDQRHGLRVVHHLAAEVHDDRELLAAALLHDCGKGRIPVWLRVLYVLAPGVVHRLAGAEDAPRGVFGRSRAAYRLLNHARLGAELAREAGSSDATVRFILGSVEDHEHHKAMALMAADDRS